MKKLQKNLTISKKISKFRKSLGYFYFDQINENIDAQRKKTAAYLTALKNIPGIKPIVELTRTKASYPYLTLIFEDAAKHNTALNIFRNSGLGVSQVYLRAITDYPYLKDIIPTTDCANAQALATKTLTLTTSRFLKEIDLEDIIKKLKKL